MFIRRRHLAPSEISRLLRLDRRVDPELRATIGRSLAIDALVGEIPPRLRQLIIARMWPVTLSENCGD